MKKDILFQVLLVSIISALLFAPPASAETRKYIMATGSVGGTFYPLGAAIAKVISQYSGGIEVSIQSTGASTENCRLLGNKKVEFGLSAGTYALYAYQGKEMFSKPYPNLRAVSYIYSDVTHWVVMAGSKIYALEDLKGKRVGVGPVGSGAESGSRILLEFAGLTYKDITPIMVPFSQSADRLRDGQLEAAVFGVAVPAATVIDLATMHKIRLIELKGEYRKRLQEKHPTYVNITIPAGTYRGIDKDVETVGQGSGLLTREDIPADDVYKITKALYEHAEEIAEIHPAGKSIKIKDAAKGIFLPFHEGALRYFKEKGLEIKQK